MDVGVGADVGAGADFSISGTTTWLWLFLHSFVWCPAFFTGFICFERPLILNLEGLVSQKSKKKP